MQYCVDQQLWVWWPKHFSRRIKAAGLTGESRLSIVQTILQNYSLPEIRGTEYLGGAGGFSGAQIWKVASFDSDLCLRRWPLSHPNKDRLDWINHVLVHVLHQDCPFVAAPLETTTGNRYVESGGFYWELAPWMPGEAIFKNDPSDTKLENVMTALARFHLGSAQVNLGFEKSQNAFGRLSSLRDAPAVLAEIGRASFEFPTEAVNQLRQIVLSQGATHARKLAAALDPFVNVVFPIQPVIRDCWHDHILFSGDAVTGLVDFGAMQMDNVALDLARVLGSLVGNEPERWPVAIEQYSKLRPLSVREVDFIYALDQCAAFLGGINWLKWVGVERRVFESLEHVETRIRHLIGRMV